MTWQRRSTLINKLSENQRQLHWVMHDAWWSCSTQFVHRCYPPLPKFDTFLTYVKIISNRIVSNWDRHLTYILTQIWHNFTLCQNCIKFVSKPNLYQNHVKWRSQLDTNLTQFYIVSKLYQICVKTKFVSKSCQMMVPIRHKFDTILHCQNCIKFVSKPNLYQNHVKWRSQLDTILHCVKTVSKPNLNQNHVKWRSQLDTNLTQFCIVLKLCQICVKIKSVSKSCQMTVPIIDIILHCFKAVSNLCQNQICIKIMSNNGPIRHA